VGELILVADADALIGLYFAGRDHVPSARTGWKRTDDHPILRKAATQLREYFDGKRTKFALPLRFTGTEFQKKVWNEIAKIPHGVTTDYSELARRAGSPDAIRATGTSTGRNPISIIIPCHRVVGKNGDLCGFAGGLETKRFLLALENVAVPPSHLRRAG
jgi:methylated-DNA-[protein]-cysteine S-methyltransferase